MTELASEVVLFLASRPRPRLVTDHQCRADLVDRDSQQVPAFAAFANGGYHLRPYEPHGRAQPRSRCGRPVWGDGKVDGISFQLCSRCWHAWCAVHGPYRLLAVNPAAAAVTDEGLARLFVNRNLAGEAQDETCACGRRGPEQTILCCEPSCPHNPGVTEPDHHQGDLA